MNPETASFAMPLPWLIIIALMSTVLFYQFRRLSHTQTLQQEREARIDQLDHDNTVLTELLSAREADLPREREEGHKRTSTVKSERDQHASSLERVKTELSELQAEHASLKTQLERIAELTEERDQARSQLSQLQSDKSQVDSDFAAYQSKAEEEHKASEEKIQLLEQAEQRLTKGFENLANRIFEEKHQKFSEVSKPSVEALLNPMRQQLGDFRKRVNEVYDKKNEQRTTLRTEINQLNERISTDALNLTMALEGDSKVRGNWGEVQLERLLEDSGLTKVREHEVPAGLKNEEGQRFQPDVIVHLPEKKDVVIDAKVSLVAYEAYHSGADDVEREAQIRAHIASLRTHIKGLSNKNYDELIGVNALDLVIMFVPIEPALLLALEHEPNLYNEAFEKGILLVSPTTLMATLQIIINRRSLLKTSRASSPWCEW